MSTYVDGLTPHIYGDTQTNSNVKLPSVVGNVYDIQNITDLWQEHYSQIFNAVRWSCNKEFHADLCMDHSILDHGTRVNVIEIREFIEYLSYNKSPGLDGITSEHMKLADRQLPVVLALLISAILIHDYVTKTMLKSIIIPIMNDKNKRVSDMENYSPICLFNVFAKIVKTMLFIRMQSQLQTTCYQFGFKP